MKKLIPSDFRTESRGFDDLPAVLAGEHASLQGLVQRRLTRTLKARREARATVADAPVINPSNAPAEIDPHELLELLGQLNQPQGSRMMASC